MRKTLAAVLGPRLRALGFQGLRAPGFSGWGPGGVECLTIQFTTGGFGSITGWYALGDSARQRLAVYLAALEAPVPSKRLADERQAYAEIVNDASVLTSRAGEWKVAPPGHRGAARAQQGADAFDPYRGVCARQGEPAG